MTWHVWSDGSCQNWPPGSPGLGFGGWAAIVEHGIDGVAYRGRLPHTTNVRMELRAAAEGLSHVDAGGHVVLHIDCTVVVSVYQLWRQGPNAVKAKQCRDRADWLALAAQFDRIRAVDLDVLGRGPRPAQHRRAHVFAGAEARAGVAGLPDNAVAVDVRKARRRRVRAALPLAHDGRCDASVCVDSCSVRLAALRVQAKRRASEARHP